ncbi:MAG: methyltransferase domain-containing protein [Microgenomates group bacterium]
MANTSWQKVAPWYEKTVGQSGHYYHQHLVLPGAIRLLDLKSDSSVLDLACGQGVLGRLIKPNLEYFGIDLAPSLIKFAQQNDRSPKHHYLVGDTEKALPLTQTDFSHAAIILAIQNLVHPELALKNAARHLSPSGRLLLVMNHPAFRIPRQSAWEIDPQNKLQYRRVNRYLSPLKIPINARPSRGVQGPITWSFHHPLQDYFKFLMGAGFVVTNLEEWASDKESEGRAAKMENRGRAEFPLFLALLAEKRPS